MVRIALAPCSPFSVTPELMRRTAELAERLDVRLHTHLAEDSRRGPFLRGGVRLPARSSTSSGSAGAPAAPGSRTACIPTRRRSSGWDAGAPVSRIARVRTRFSAPGWPRCASCVMPASRSGIGCDGSASADCASLWLETRGALLLARLRGGAAAMQSREALEMATLGGAACLGRDDVGALAPGRAGDLVVWPVAATVDGGGIAFAGALSDPVEALLRCGPIAPRHTIVAGRALVADGRLTAGGVEQMLRRHRSIAAQWLAAARSRR